MLTRRYWYVVWIVWSLFAAGCDPVRTTAQSVRLRVVESQTGQPIAGAQVQLKYDFDTAEPLSEEKGQPPLSPEEYHKHRREFWDQLPWFSGLTDENGQADIDIEYSGLDRTWGSKPPAWRDEVTGKPYLVQVRVRRALEEQFSVVMEPSESVKGKLFTVTVVHIEDPEYVEDPGYTETQ